MKRHRDREREKKEKERERGKKQERGKKRERGNERERGRKRERLRIRVCVCKALVDWKENRLFITLIMQNLYIVNQVTDLPNSFLYLNNL